MSTVQVEMMNAVKRIIVELNITAEQLQDERVKNSLKRVVLSEYVSATELAVNVLAETMKVK